MVDHTNINIKRNVISFYPSVQRRLSIDDFIRAWEVEVAQREAYILTYDLGISEVVQMSTKINLDRFNFPDCDIRLKDMHAAIQASIKKLKEQGTPLPDVNVFNTLSTMASYSLTELKAFLVNEIKKDLPELKVRFGLEGNFTPDTFLVAVRKLYQTLKDPKHTPAPDAGLLKQLKEMDKYTITDWVEKKLADMLYGLTQPMQGQLWNHRLTIEDLRKNINDGRMSAALLDTALNSEFNAFQEVAQSAPAV